MRRLAERLSILAVAALACGLAGCTAVGTRSRLAAAPGYAEFSPPATAEEELARGAARGLSGQRVALRGQSADALASALTAAQDGR